jgi:DNA ligase-1
MNSNQIFKEVEAIAADSSKTVKATIVKACIGDADFKRVMEYTYNPFKRYGMRKRPETIGEHVGREFDAGTWELLDDLIARRLTGNNAIDAVRGELTALSEESAELLWRIISKDMRAGFSESTINKACKGLIPEFPYMRCSLPKHVNLNEWDWKGGIFSQEKADGMFVNATSDDGSSAVLSSRQGTPFPSEPFAEIIACLDDMGGNVQRHGEMLVLVDGKVAPREIGNGILNRVISGGEFEANERPILKLWDEVQVGVVTPKGADPTPYCARLKVLLKKIADLPLGAPVSLIDTRSVHSIKEAYGHYAKLLAKGKEGTIVKQRNAIWRDGTSKEQIKLKLEVPVDLVIAGIVAGNVGTKNEGRAGSLTCQTSDGLLEVDVAIKGEKMRDDVDANSGNWLNGIITVVSNGVLKPSPSNDLHSLFLPRFAESCLRTDKTEADSLARVFDQFDNAVKNVTDLVPA